MPIYDYTCLSCGAKEEILVQHSTDTPPCPRCGRPELEKSAVSLFSSVISSGKKAAAQCGSEGPCGSAAACGPHGCGMPGSCCGG